MKVVNLLQLPGGSESQQVMLQVRFAEVSRRALLELGVSLFTGPTGYKDMVMRSTTQQFSAPNFEGRIGPAPAGITDDGKLTFGDFLNLFLFNTKYDVGAVIRALQTRGLFQSLAEPNLIAYNGQEASFLAGGEIPVPVVQGASNAVTISVQGIWHPPERSGRRLPATRSGCRVRPEVSTLDFPNGIILSGFRIPGALHAPRGNRRRASGRTVVCHRRSSEQPVAGRPASRCPGWRSCRSSASCFRAKAAGRNGPS